MTIRLTASVPSPAATVAVDPWIPLSVVWDVEPDASPLYLFVRDPVQGYVELKVQPESGALLGVVVIDLPRPDGYSRQLPDASLSQRSETAVLDLEIWSWKSNPDYREPARRDIDAECPLSVSTSADQMTIWFSDLPVDRVLKAGPVGVGVSIEGDLVAVRASGLAVVAK